MSGRTQMAVSEFTAADRAAISSASKILKAKYRQYVEYADVQQECLLWLVKNYRKVEGWREAYEERHAERMVVKALRNAGERYCREEKAQKVGYSTEDEFFYSIATVANLLEVYFDHEWMTPPGIQLGVPASGTPASDGNNLAAMIADVGRAYEALPAPDRALLYRIYGDAANVSDAIALEALEWGCTQSAAYSRIRRVVGRLRALLGGPSPYREDRDAEF